MEKRQIRPVTTRPNLTVAEWYAVGRDYLDAFPFGPPHRKTKAHAKKYGRGMLPEEFQRARRAAEIYDRDAFERLLQRSQKAKKRKGEKKFKLTPTQLRVLISVPDASLRSEVANLMLGGMAVSRLKTHIKARLGGRRGPGWRPPYVGAAWCDAREQILEIAQKWRHLIPAIQAQHPDGPTAEIEKQFKRVGDGFDSLVKTLERDRMRDQLTPTR